MKNIIEKEITKIFQNDKDVKEIYCIKTNKDMIQKKFDTNILTLENGQSYYYNWYFCRGIIIVNYCKV